MASSRSSDIKSAAALIATGTNRINALTVFTDGTNAATVTVYDNTAGSGKVVAQNIAPGSVRTQHIIFENPVFAENGLYATVSGTGASYIVYFGG